MVSFWETVADRLRTDRRVFVALVVRHSVHSPGTTGARMAVFTDRSTQGTIGGGIMEANIVRSAGDALEAGGRPRIQKLVHRKSGEGEKSGLICSGHQTNLYLILDHAEHQQLLDEVVTAERRDTPSILQIDPEGLSLALLDDPHHVPRHLLVTEGSNWHYQESVMNLSRVAILGAGHCGLALSQLLHRLGYYVSVFDTRPRVTTMLVNDAADEKHTVEDFKDAGALIRLPQHTSVVVMTTELSSDVRALLGVLGGPFPFVGAMGSRAKIAAMRKELADHGVSPDVLSKLVAPVGLPIRSNTPEEIAVSVAAQLLQLRADTSTSNQAKR